MRHRSVVFAVVEWLVATKCAHDDIVFFVLYRGSLLCDDVFVSVRCDVLHLVSCSSPSFVTLCVSLFVTKQDTLSLGEKAVGQFAPPTSRVRILFLYYVCVCIDQMVSC